MCVCQRGSGKERLRFTPSLSGPSPHTGCPPTPGVTSTVGLRSGGGAEEHGGGGGRQRGDTGYRGGRVALESEGARWREQSRGGLGDRGRWRGTEEYGGAEGE